MTICSVNQNYKEDGFLLKVEFVGAWTNQRFGFGEDYHQAACRKAMNYLKMTNSISKCMLETESKLETILHCPDIEIFNMNGDSYITESQIVSFHMGQLFKGSNDKVLRAGASDTKSDAKTKDTATRINNHYNR